MRGLPAVDSAVGGFACSAALGRGGDAVRGSATGIELHPVRTGINSVGGRLPDDGL